MVSIHLAQDRDKRRAVVNAVMKLRIRCVTSQKTEPINYTETKVWNLPTFGFHKTQGISWLDEELSASQGGLCSKKLVSEINTSVYQWYNISTRLKDIIRSSWYNGWYTAPWCYTNSSTLKQPLSVSVYQFPAVRCGVLAELVACCSYELTYGSWKVLHLTLSHGPIL
jgi:hypothetical protein